MHVQINNDSNVPIFQQIVDQVKGAVARGACRPGEAIPSVRQMAAATLVNPNTVFKAYRDLERDEVIVTRRGLGAFVAKSAPKRCLEDRRGAIRTKLHETLQEALQAGIDAEELIEALRLMRDEHDSKRG